MVLQDVRLRGLYRLTLIEYLSEEIIKQLDKVLCMCWLVLIKIASSRTSPPTCRSKEGATDILPVCTCIIWLWQLVPEKLEEELRTLLGFDWQQRWLWAHRGERVFGHVLVTLDSLCLAVGIDQLMPVSVERSQVSYHDPSAWFQPAFEENGTLTHGATIGYLRDIRSVNRVWQQFVQT